MKLAGKLALAAGVGVGAYVIFRRKEISLAAQARQTTERVVGGGFISTLDNAAGGIYSALSGLAQKFNFGGKGFGDGQEDVS